MKIRAGERRHFNNSVMFTLTQLPELMESLLLGKDPGHVWSTSALHFTRQGCWQWSTVRSKVDFKQGSPENWIILQEEKHEVGGNQYYKIELRVIHVEESSVGVSNGKQLTPFIPSEVHKKSILVHF